MTRSAHTPSFTERRSPRVPVQLPVVVEHAGRTFHATVVNLGVGGAFVQGMPLAYGAHVHVHLTIDEKHGPTRLPAVVRWHDATGFGVQFLELGAKDTHALSRLMTIAAE